jgi:hypothetical protein
LGGFEERSESMEKWLRDLLSLCEQYQEMDVLQQGSLHLLLSRQIGPRDIEEVDRRFILAVLRRMCMVRWAGTAGVEVERLAVEMARLGERE